MPQPAARRKPNTSSTTKFATRNKPRKSVLNHDTFRWLSKLQAVFAVIQSTIVIPILFSSSVLEKDLCKFPPPICGSEFWQDLRENFVFRTKTLKIIFWSSSSPATPAPLQRHATPLMVDLLCHPLSLTLCLLLALPQKKKPKTLRYRVQGEFV